MLRGFRHTLFFVLQGGVLLSAGIALVVFPPYWPAVLTCAAGAILTTWICERVAGSYLRHTLGSLRRLADDVGHGRPVQRVDTHPGEDFYKLASAINLVATRVAEAGAKEQALQAQLRQKESLAVLGELAANVAHEVNNPLDGVQNCARILRRCLDDPARASQMLDLIDGGLARIELIVRRLLTLARHNVIRPQPTDVRSVVESAIAAVANKIEGSHVRLVRHYGLEPVLASVDGPLVEQVFVNLLTNALDSMPGGGELSMRIERESSDCAGNLRIEIADSGTGIAPEVMPRIFEPFVTTKSAGKGTGLGLAIASRIVDAHRGSIGFAARETGGTTFTVRLPVANSLRMESGTQTDAVAAPQHAG